jgi:hypothetical protein
MPDTAQGKPKNPVVVAIAALLLPGLGYWLLGQRTRGLAVGVSIFCLFVLGVLIGGIRIVDPPGYGEYGYHVMIVQPSLSSELTMRVDPTSEANEANPLLQAGTGGSAQVVGWALLTQPLGELSNKPWYIGQILCGPISLAMSAVAIVEAHPVDPSIAPPVSREPPSHSRSWEIGTLYTAVAGMLNLLAIIDSAYRAAEPEELSPTEKA